MTSPAEIRLSIALVTRNRPDSLRRCLQSLRAQGEQPFEIVISDDSDDRAPTASVAAEFGARHIDGPRRGLYANRNFSALACQGTHIRTMDDDHTFPAEHFAQCLEAVRQSPESVWTCGEASFLDGKAHDSTPWAIQLHPSGVGCTVTDPDDNWGIADGSTIYPRSIFDAGLRFYEGYRYGSSYLEFGALLYHRGWRSRCVRGAFIEHHADNDTLTRSAGESCLFASLCYNLRFRPNLLRALRHAVPYRSCMAAIPRLLPIIYARWKS